MSTVPVWVGTPSGQWWEVADLDATIEHVTGQVQKGVPIPVVGPVGHEDACAGYLLPRWVAAVRWKQAQP